MGLIWDRRRTEERKVAEEECRCSVTGKVETLQRGAGRGDKAPRRAVVENGRTTEERHRSERGELSARHDVGDTRKILAPH